ncbi:hypothetical protein Tco_0595937 [Tanacetum coccineum]
MLTSKIFQNGPTPVLHVQKKATQGPSRTTTIQDTESLDSCRFRPSGKNANWNKIIGLQNRRMKECLVRIRQGLCPRTHRQERERPINEVIAPVARIEALGSFYPLLLIWDS